MTRPGHNPFLQQETLVAQQELAVTYFVERDRYDPYEIVVVGEQRREEVSRITLRGPEIKQVPGTFGDPFRVVQALPGVASVVSLLPFPIVRGASPSSTGFLLDGTRVPLLYHLLSGPSVIHPDFIDEIQFYPGGAPVAVRRLHRRHRRRPHRARAPRRAPARLRREPPAGRRPRARADPAARRHGHRGRRATATRASCSASRPTRCRCRTGTTSCASTAARRRTAGPSSRSARATSSTRRRRPPTRNDPNPPLEPSLILGFHRLDLRYHHTFGALVDDLRARSLGYDRTDSQGTDFTVLARRARR